MHANSSQPSFIYMYRYVETVCFFCFIIMAAAHSSSVEKHKNSLMWYEIKKILSCNQ